MWQVQRQIAALAVARLSDSSDLRFTLVTAVPAAAYLIAAIAAWLVHHRRAVRGRRVGLRSLLALVAMLAPGLALLRWVHWPD